MKVTYDFSSGGGQPSSWMGIGVNQEGLPAVTPAVAVIGTNGGGDDDDDRPYVVRKYFLSSVDTVLPYCHGDLGTYKQHVNVDLYSAAP
jgi:hypothetical protein